MNEKSNSQKIIKFCWKCQKVLPPEDFYSYKSSPCRKCHCKIVKTWQCKQKDKNVG